VKLLALLCFIVSSVLCVLGAFGMNGPRVQIGWVGVALIAAGLALEVA
jgi:hypothetical protein